MFETKLGVPSKTSEADIWTCLCFLNSRHETPKKETISQKSFNQAITFFSVNPTLVGKVKLVTQDIFLQGVFFAENNMFIDKCFVPRCPKAEAWEYLLFWQKFLNSCSCKWILLEGAMWPQTSTWMAKWTAASSPEWLRWWRAIWP